MKAQISILLAMLVFFASIGMAKTTHFCMGNEMKSEIGFGKKHLDCGMGMPMDHSDNDSDNHKDPNSCCENITEHLQVDDDVQLKKQDIKLQLDFAISLVQVFVFGSEPIVDEPNTFSTDYFPPISRDYQILYQNFLI
jgi:hypothetical protein